MARFEMSAVEMTALMPASMDGGAYFELACLYAGGRGLAADLVQAHKWFNVAASRGSAEAVARRSELAAEMSDAEIAAAQREARLFLARR